MAQIKQEAKDQLARIKKNVESSFSYFKENYKRFREYKQYVFKETINQDQRAMLQGLSRPIIEFNLGASAINRLMGEFADHEPGIETSPAEGIPVNQEVLDVVEGSIRSTLHEANKKSFSNRIYKEMLSGGFSVAKIFTDYSSPMSFNQTIYWENVFDSTLVGFDPLARTPHKGDGQYSFEIYPMLEEEFKEQFPQAQVTKLSYVKDIESFTWSYKDSQNKKIILVADYYEKKKKKVQIVKLSDGRVMTTKRYQQMEELWQKEQYIEQIPAKIGKPRWTTLEIICNYKLVQDEILEYHETDYCYLPHVFFDGNSEILAQGTSNTTYQFTIPYFYHAKGAQDLMNFTGIAIANNIENLSMAQFIVKKEAIPQEEDYIDAITEPQVGKTIVVNAYSENNPDKPIPDPIREVQHPPLPPEVMGTFNNAIGLIQAILGSMASNPSNDQNYISGKAIIEATSADNATAMSYVQGYLAGLAQIANIHVDLMPKYIVGKRTIPIVYKNGETIYQDVNIPGKPSLNYEERAIKVNINAGVNFQVQKEKAMQQLIGLMQASPSFAEFMNSPDGLKILIKNLTIYGSDELQEAVPKWIQLQEQQKQQAMQMQQQAMMQDPRLIKAQADVQKVKLQEHELQMKDQQQQIDNQFKAAELALEQERVQNEAILVQHEAQQEEINAAVQREKANAEIIAHSLDAAAKLSSIKHEQKMGEHESVRKSVELHHKINKEKGE